MKNRIFNDGNMKKKLTAILGISSFLLLNIAKIIFFHAELVNYRQDFTNVLYVCLFTTAWTVFLFVLLFGRSKTLLLLFYVFQFFYMGINFSYFHYYNSYLNIRHALSLLGEFTGVVFSLSVPLHPKLLLFLIDLPALYFVLHEMEFPLFQKALLKRLLIAASGILLVLLYTYKFVMTADSVTRSDRARFIGNYGLLSLQIYDFVVSTDYLDRLNPENAPLIENKENDHPFRNIVFIQVEALDANVLSLLLEGKPVMPNLLRLSKENIFFPYTLSYHKGGGTSDAEFSVLNSVEPLDNYAAINLPGYSYSNSIVKVLNNNNYTTVAFHGNEGKYWNRTEAFASMGFNSFFDIQKMELKEYGWGARDEDLFSFVENKMVKENKPFFYFIITMSSHGPYKNVQRYYYNDRFDTVPESNNDRAYLNSMEYVDREIGRFLDNTRILLSDSFIFIYGDHSEYYSENGIFHRSATTFQGDRLEFVPLIIIPPSDFSYNNTGTIASFLDIAPTVLESCGAAYSIHSFGENLLKKGGKQSFPPVPYKGRLYERNELLDIAESTVKQ